MTLEEYAEEVQGLKDDLSNADEVIGEWKEMHDTATKRITQLEQALETVKADATYTIDRVL